MKIPEWLGKAVFYEIYPQSFYDSNADGIGDIPGIVQKLDYVKSLGCNAIWMNPCFDSPFMDAGYDVRDYRKVAQRYGTNDDLKQLFDKAHKKGIRVILDLVVGHTSDQHEWFKQSKQAERNEYSDRYIWTDSFQDVPEGLPYVSGMSERDGNYILNFFASQPALNYGFNKITASWQMHYTDPRVQKNFEEVLNIMRFWLEIGCDGFRVDLAMTLVKNDGLTLEKEGTSQLWRKAMSMLEEEYPEAVLISEWGFPEYSVAAGGFHSDFCMQHSSGFASLFHNNKVAQDGAKVSYFSSSGNGNIHDFLTPYQSALKAIKGKGYYSLITGNHDTVRLTNYFNERERKIIVSFIFTMPGVPFLYYGDEIGMNYSELPSKEGGYFRTGSRTPMQWNSHEKNMGFSEAETDELYLPLDSRDVAPSVEVQEIEEHSMLNTVRKLLKLRNADTALQADDNFEIIYSGKNGYPFVYGRGAYTMVMNPSGRDVNADVEVKGDVVYKIGGANIVGHSTVVEPKSFIIYKKS